VRACLYLAAILDRRTFGVPLASETNRRKAAVARPANGDDVRGAGRIDLSGASHQIGALGRAGSTARPAGMGEKSDEKTRRGVARVGASQCGAEGA